MSFFPNAQPSETFRIPVSAAGNNAALISDHPCVVGMVNGYNNSATSSAIYLKFYDQATLPTVGQDVPAWSEYLAPQSKFPVTLNLAFENGVAIAFTAGPEDVDVSPIAAGDIMNFNLSHC